MRRSQLETRSVRPGGWVVIVPDVEPGVEPHTVTIGGQTMPAGVEYGKLMVRCPALAPGRYTVQVDAGTSWPIVVEP